jgi:hypothetical protein
MKEFGNKKKINLILILLMVSHVTFLHDLIDNYDVCFRNDGLISIKDHNDLSHNQIEFLQNNNSNIKHSVRSNNCDDVCISNECFENGAFTISYKSNISAQLNFSILQLTKQYQESEILYTSSNYLFNNLILQSYSTVSLII